MPEDEYTFEHAEAGLKAFLVIDDTTLGPAAGGIRTHAYSSDAEALADARKLARAMTLKCSLAGLDAGGGKMVVLDHPGLDRKKVFAFLGARVEELEGRFRTAGDYGTTSDDIRTMAEHTQWAHDFTHPLADAVAHGVCVCMAALADEHEGRTLEGLRVAVQGCGFIGAAVARALKAAGATLLVSDISAPLVQATASSLDAEVIEPDELLAADVDVIAPCAIGGVIDTQTADSIRAWGVCGAANNILASPEAGDRLMERDVLFVPDPVSSAGGVIEGIGTTVMGLDDRTPLIERLGETTRAIVRESKAEKTSPSAVAERLAERRIAQARSRA